MTPRTLVFSFRLTGGCIAGGGVLCIGAGGGAGWGMGGACIAGGGALCIGAGGIAGSAWGAGGTVAAACEAGVEGGCSGRHQVGSSLAVVETGQSTGEGGWVGTEERGIGASSGGVSG